jgi:hypothetical protein
MVDITRAAVRDITAAAMAAAPRPDVSPAFIAGGNGLDVSPVAAGPAQRGAP